MDYGWQTIYGTAPSKSNCYKVITLGGHGSLGKTAALYKYEKDFMLQCGHYRDKKIDQLFRFEINVFYPSNRSDLDNSLKVVLDCLQYCKAITNDNKCIEIAAHKFVDPKEPRIEFRIITD